MGSSNDEREKIQRLNEHMAVPIKLITGSMKVFTTVCHISKPNRSSNSCRGVINVSLTVRVRLAMSDANEEFRMFFFKVKNLNEKFEKPLF